MASEKKYLLFRIPLEESPKREIVNAFLMNMPFEGILEEDDSITAFVANSDWKRKDLQEMVELANQLEFEYEISEVDDKNWNDEWEKNYKPFEIKDVVLVKAPFHKEKASKSQIEIIISPQMAFGTGHHPTTEMMLTTMNHLKFKNKRVLDFGAGSGVLSIAADKWGAKKVIALENDKKAFENLKENIKINNCENTHAINGSLEDLNDKKYHIILANINRNVLMDYAKGIRKKCKSNATLLISGILEKDQKMVVHEYKKQGFKLKSSSQTLDWICLELEKK